MANRDVELVIRARNEASKAIDSVAGSLRALTGQQDATGRSAIRADDLLSKLGQQFQSLQSQVSSLSGLTKAAGQIDKATGAVTRLGSAAETALADANRLSAASESAAAATARLRAESEAAAAALKLQKVASAESRAELTKVNSEVTKAENSYTRLFATVTAAKTPSDALKESLRSQRDTLVALYERQTTATAAHDANTAAQKRAITASSEAGAALRTAARNERDLAAAAAEASAKLDAAVQALYDSQKLLRDMSIAAKEAGGSLGVATLGQQELAAAAKEAGAELARVTDLLEQQAKARAIAVAEASQANVNKLTGVAQPSAGNARASAAVFEAAAAEQERLALESKRQADAAAASQERMVASAARLRAELDPAAAAQNRMNAALAEAQALYDAGIIKLGELVATERLLVERSKQVIDSLRGNPNAARLGLFGLKPYELQNLSYQINDVFTQLASGTSVTQTIAQQSGQILQLFPRALASVAAFLPVIALLAIPVGLIATGIARIYSLRSQQREFNGVLEATADGARYQTTALIGSTEAIRNFGIGAADANDAVKLFIREGLDPARFVQVAKAAKDMSDAIGIDLTDALKQVTAAATGGYAAIAKFDDANNALTAAERDRIRVLFESGQADEARALALNLFSKTMDAAAKKSRTDWSVAVDKMGEAWRRFTDILANSTLIKATVVVLDSLAASVIWLTDKLDGVRTPKDLVDGIAASVGRIKQMQADLDATYRNDPQRATRLPYQQALKRIEDEKAALRALIAEQKKKQSDVPSTTADPKLADTEAAKKARQEVAAALNEQRMAMGDLTDQQRIQIAGELAYRKAIVDTGDTVIADMQRRFARETEIERQRKALDFGRVAQKIAGAESGGDVNAKNPLSSATGLGQFIRSTFITLFRTEFPAAAKGMSDDAIALLRRDGDISRKLIEAYARDNADILKKAGLAVNEASVYLAHFLGPQGAVKVLRAASNAPVAPLVGSAAVKANPSILGGGRTAGDVVAFAQRKVGQTDGARASLDLEAQVTANLTEQTRKFNETLDQRLAGWNAEIEALKTLHDQSTLTLADKFAAERAGEVAKAVQQAENEAVRSNIILSDERRATIAATRGALYDLANAESQHNQILAEKRRVISNLVGLEQQREGLIRELSSAQNNGDSERVAELNAQIAALGAEIKAALPAARELAASLGDEKAVAAVERVSERLASVTTEIVTAQQLNQNFANTGTRAFDQFTSALAQGQEVFASLGGALLTFASSFFQQIANMIIQALLLKAIMATTFGKGVAGGINNLFSAAPLAAAGAVLAGAGSQLTAAGVSIGVSAAAGLAFATALGTSASILLAANTVGAATGGIFHGGGIAGSANRTRSGLMPALFTNALRYHTGGIAGLLPNEVPAVLKRGEEILTEDNPRHRKNAGRGGSALTDPVFNVKVVNTIDAGDFVSQGAQTAVGEKAILNIVRTNKTLIKSLLA